MGIYKNVQPVYGKNEKNERVYTGLRVDGVFYEGIRKVTEIGTVSPTTKQVKSNNPNRARAGNKTYKDDEMKTGKGPKAVSKPSKLGRFKR